MDKILMKIRKGKLFPKGFRQVLRKLGLYEIAQKIWHPVKSVLYNFSPPKTVKIGEAAAQFRIIEGTDERQIFENIEDERPILTDILSRIESDDVFADIGANIGLYSILVGSMIEEGCVISFEPNPVAFDHLCENLEINNIGGYRKQVALAEENGTIEFLIPPKAPSAATLVTENPDQERRLTDRFGETRKENVRTIVGDRLFNTSEIASPTVIKIDVEGAEMKVLKGLNETLSRPDVRIVYCEVHPFIDEFGYEQEDIEQYLQKLGFETVRLRETGESYIIRAEREQ